MLIFVSWVSFWLDPNATVARVSLGVTTLLSMATQISGINASQPPVSYTKAIDVWTGVCLTFVFGALLEFALVNYASRSDVHQAAAKQQQQRLAKWNMEQSLIEGGNQDMTYGMVWVRYCINHIHLLITFTFIEKLWNSHGSPKTYKLVQTVAFKISNSLQTYRCSVSHIFPIHVWPL